MTDKYKCDDCGKTFNEPVEREHSWTAPDNEVFTEYSVSGSGAWFPPGYIQTWTDKHCPYCNSAKLSEWFEGYINWEDYY